MLRGPAAAVYGSDAIGGVVQLFTQARRRRRRARTSASASAATALRKAEAGVSGRPSGAFDYSFGVAREESKGFNVQPLQAHAARRRLHSPDRDGYRSTSANAQLGFQITPDQRIEATVL